MIWVAYHTWVDCVPVQVGETNHSLSTTVVFYVLMKSSFVFQWCQGNVVRKSFFLTSRPQTSSCFAFVFKKLAPSLQAVQAKPLTELWCIQTHLQFKNGGKPRVAWTEHFVLQKRTRMDCFHTRVYLPVALHPLHLTWTAAFLNVYPDCTWASIRLPFKLYTQTGWGTKREGCTTEYRLLSLLFSVHLSF